MDRTLAQFKAGSSGRPTGWYRMKNGVVALMVKLAGKTFDINGVATNHLPADRSRSSSPQCASRSTRASSITSWRIRERLSAHWLQTIELTA